MKNKYKQIIPYIIFITLFIILFSYFTAGGPGKEAYSQETSIGSNPLLRPLAISLEDDEAICSLNSVVCPSEKSLPSILYSEGRMAEISFFSELDSCHTGKSCLMANGKKAAIGYVACPRRIKLGTKILINGAKYECGDRTAKWVDGRFDIFLFILNRAKVR